MSRLTGSASGPLVGTVSVPGDKSMSHRALILGALASGTTRIDGLLEGEDVLATARAVAALGATVERVAAGEWRVTGGGEWRSPAAPVDCGNSGTGARLLMGAVAGFPISVTFTGDESLSGRPMARVLGPLREMGAGVEATAGDRMPVTIHGGNLNGMHFVNDKASAQVKSAILLAGLRAGGEVEVIEPARSRDHSENMLRAFGVEIEGGERVRLGAKRTLTATDVSIPGDPSSAAFLLVSALIVPGSEVTVTSVMTNPLRTGLFATLVEMGADLTMSNERELGGEPVADISARFGPLKGVTVPAERAPSMIDEYPILAIAAAFAQGRSVMHGLAELRVKESDRLAAIIAGLAACGVEARAEGDSLIVEGGLPRGGGSSAALPKGGAVIDAHHDHRIAMSFLTLGLASAEPVTVTGAATIATSFPDYAGLMRRMGARIA